MSVSSQRRGDIIDALRRGTVPQYGLDALAVGLAPFEAAFDEELARFGLTAAEVVDIALQYRPVLLPPPQTSED